MKEKNKLNALLYILFAQAVGALSALITGNAFKSFFESYTKPPLMPAQWVFPVAWVLLYALMGYSAYLISLEEDGKDKKTATMLYYVQLFLNFCWSIAFFRLELLWGSVGIIALLVLTVAAMLLYFRRLQPFAAYFNIPYLLWLLFATYLNIATAVIN